jgi:RimJ/RimL family protein N-acetyltransferase
MKKENLDISIRSIKKSDSNFLYELLKERDSRANISHKKMPSIKQHEKFIQSKPYSKWYIIQNYNKEVGSIYLSKNNEIGIFLIKKNQSKGIGFNALKLLMEKNPKIRYLANVNPKNKKSIEFFKKNGFKLIQHTYELENNN